MTGEVPQAHEHVVAARWRVAEGMNGAIREVIDAVRAKALHEPETLTFTAHVSRDDPHECFF